MALGKDDLDFSPGGVDLSARKSKPRFVRLRALQEKEIQELSFEVDPEIQTAG